MNIDDCASTPCLNKGQCIDDANWPTPVGNAFACNCTLTGYSGSACSKPVDRCILLPAPCDPLARCAYTGPGDYTCECPAGYSGSGRARPEHNPRPALCGAHS